MDATPSTRPTTRRTPLARWETPDFGALKAQLATLNPGRDDSKRQRPDDTINTEAVLGSPPPTFRPTSLHSHRIVPPPRVLARPQLASAPLLPPQGAPSSVPQSAAHNTHRLEEMLKSKQAEIAELRKQLADDRLGAEEQKNAMKSAKDGEIQKLRLGLQELQGDLRAKELAASTQKSKFANEMRSADAKIAALESELETARKTTENAEKSLGEERKRHKATRGESQAFQAENVRLESELATAKANEKIAQDRLKIAEKTVQTAETECKNEQKMSAGFKQEIARLNAALETEKQALIEASAEFEHEQQKLSVEVGTLRETLDREKHEHELDTLALGQLRKKVERFEGELLKSRTELSAANDDLSKLRGELAEQKVGHEDSPVAKRLRQELGDAERRAAMAEAQAAERQQRVAEMETKVREMAQRIKQETGNPLVASLQREIEARSEANAQLADEKTRLETQIVRLKQREQDLVREGTLLNNKLEAAAAHLSELAPDAQRLRSCLAELSELRLRFDQLRNEYTFEIDKLKAQCEAAVEAERQQAAKQQRDLRHELDEARAAQVRELEQKLAETSTQAASSLSGALEAQQTALQAQLQEQLAQVERLSQERTQQIQNVAELEVAKHNRKLEEWFAQQLEQQLQEQLQEHQRQEHQVDSGYKKKYKKALEAMELMLTYNDHVRERARAVDEDLIFIKDIAARCLLQLYDDEKEARLVRGLPPKRTAAGAFFAVLAAVRMSRGSSRPKVPVKLEQEYKAWGAR